MDNATKFLLGVVGVGILINLITPTRWRDKKVDQFLGWRVERAEQKGKKHDERVAQYIADPRIWYCDLVVSAGWCALWIGAAAIASLFPGAASTKVLLIGVILIPVMGHADRHRTYAYQIKKSLLQQPPEETEDEYRERKS